MRLNGYWETKKNNYMTIKNKKYYLIHILISTIICVFFIYSFSVERNWIFILFAFMGTFNIYKYYYKYTNFDNLEEKDKTIL